MLKKDSVNCILLCGGKGTRMQSKTKHKVCFEIDGVPAILRSLNNFEQADVDRFVVVVGVLSEQVIECIGSESKDAAFVFQKEQKGTGNAAVMGINLIEKFDVEGPIIITMGDKISDPEFIKRVVEKFSETGADLLVSLQPKEINPSGGRIIFDENGKPIGNREEPDTKKAVIYKKLLSLLNEKIILTDIPKEIENYTASIISSSKKRDKVLNELSLLDYSNVESLRQIVQERAIIKLNNKEYDPEWVDNSDYTNASLYMISRRAAKYAFPLLKSNNAQNEEYLTDVIEILASSGEYKLESMTVENKNEIMSYNNVEELLEIEDYYRQLRTHNEITPNKASYKSVKEWLDLFEAENLFEGPLHECLADIYGDDKEQIAERRKAYIDVLKLFADQYGITRRVVISRAPGRINIMGKHIDHRGGNVNVMSINKDVIVVAAAREDDRIRIVNTNDAFKERNFSISEHLIELDWDSWLSYLESGEIEKMIINAKGDWVNYVKAPILRLQYQFRDRKLKGMDMAFTGNIPISAGLSSSSAIVVSTAEAFHLLNNIDLTPQRFVELCGEGEWYVGSRGGAADHAAMKFAKRGHVVKLGFLPFVFEDMFKFPDGYKLIIANSQVKSNKTTNAKDAFNSRIAAYEFGVMLFKEKYPQYKGVVEHLRDISPKKLGITPSKVFELLMELPEMVKQDEVYDLICGENKDNENYKIIKRILTSHKSPDYYYVRAITMYGVAECCRASLCKEVLDAGDIDGFGKMMNTSHDGDRVVYYDKDGKMQEYDWGVTDVKLQGLINDLRSESPERVLMAQIEKQPGGYACSVPEIDYIVDVSLSVKGVMGAQISGAGLGGCVMILVEEGAVDVLIAKLESEYYVPKGMQPDLTVCVPVKGSGILAV